MSSYPGIDTSNYTTSLAVFDDANGITGFERKILQVKEGEVGLRQSDAVFQHIQNLPVLFQSLGGLQNGDIAAIGCSARPRDEEGSYMPCFTVGTSFAQSLASCMGVPCYRFSHQAGHIAAAAYSASRADLLESEFIAFHVSGGTTEVVLVSPDCDQIIRTSLISSSLDLKAGQAIDRVGRMLHLPFPAGKYVEELANKSEKRYKCKPFVRNGSPSISGLENKCQTMLSQGEAAENVARYCLDYITAALLSMAEACQEKFKNRTMLFSGGVMSDMIIRNEISNRYDAVFSDPFYSSDNAAGIAFLTKLKHGR